jgi:cellulose synthase (UDP-forming)
MSADTFYFRRFEHRRPPPPLPYNPIIEGLWQFFATAALVLGAWYIWWRWTSSLNWDALWFAIPLALAETLAFVGLILFVYNLWRVEDYPKRPPPARIGECDPHAPDPDRPPAVDVFIATFNEEEELVRLSIQDAMRVRYPHPIELKVHVLDDGRRETMRRVAEEEGANYITRTNNAGFKAGNLRNAMEQTSGDFIVILDADSRPFPSFLENILGYFRDPDVAFVQSPQWFYDLPDGERLPELWARKAGAAGRGAGKLIEAVFGEIRLGEDPFVNDPKMFFDIIQRRRNRVNAPFCCGAASVHRREAVMFVALRAFAQAVDGAAKPDRGFLGRLARRNPDPEKQALQRWQAAQEEELTPYKFHVSEDIYSSIVLHQDRHRRWKSVLHPDVETRMLSPQDLLTWTIQRYKYAGGSLDILIHDNPITRPGLSLGQRLMYLNTFWSYLGGLWNIVFLLAPIIFLFTAIPPVSAYTLDFFLRILPFLVCLELAMMFGTWGIAGYKSKVTFLASFPLSLQALWAVLRKQKIKFHVTPKDRQEGNFLHLVWPQAVIMVLTMLGIVWASISLALGRDAYTFEGVLANGLWGLNNILAMSVMVRAAFWKPPYEEEAA